MNAAIVFDVSSDITTIKSRLKDMGYWGAWTSNGITYSLPNNSMWKPNCELLQAKNDIMNIVTTLNIGKLPVDSIILQRCIVFSVTPWEGIEGI